MNEFSVFLVLAAEAGSESEERSSAEVLGLVVLFIGLFLSSWAVAEVLTALIRGKFPEQEIGPQKVSVGCVILFLGCFLIPVVSGLALMNHRPLWGVLILLLEIPIIFIGKAWVRYLRR